MTIFFDIDDTLLDHRAAERAGLAHAHAEVPGLDQVPLGELQEVYHGHNRRLWEAYGRGDIGREQLSRDRFRLTAETLELPETLADTARHIYMQAYRESWSWVPGARETLEAVSARYRVGFITNGFKEIQQAKAERFGLRAYSDLYVISEEVGIMKPAQGIFDHAARLAGESPENLLYVGDSYGSDIVGAKGAGWKAAWFTRVEAALLQSVEVQADLVFQEWEVLKKYLNVE